MSANLTTAELRRALIEAAGALVENYPARMLALNLADALRCAEQVGDAGGLVSYHLRDAGNVFLRRFGTEQNSGTELWNDTTATERRTPRPHED